MKILVPIVILILTATCVNVKTTELDFLVGTWKRENKEQFEVWEKNKPTELIGYSYIMNGNQKIITETLVIKRLSDHFVYEATVPDQNEGKTVQFVLNKETASPFSFENNHHDFPKKIQYEKIDDDEIKVSVLGDNEEGFSYVQIRQ
jgi:hypothetical protein